MNCVHCGREFEPSQNKPGKVNECWQCGSKTETTARVGANMIWTGKQAPEIEIKSLASAKKFAAKTRRFGAGVTASIVVSKKKAESDLFRNGQWMSDESIRED
jgi:DNA-directed RNA polymerase subunit RPC12/RpoP